MSDESSLERRLAPVIINTKKFTEYIIDKFQAIEKSVMLFA